MNRRRFIEIASLGLLGFSGCTGEGGNADPSPTPTGTPTESPTPSPTPTPTPSPTPSPTPTPPAPDIDFVNLVSSWDSFGDARNNAIREATKGEQITIAARYTSWVHDGTSDETIQVEIYDSAGDRVAFKQDFNNQIVDRSGLSEWEWSLVFDATWEPGEYTAEVVVRDDISGKVSDKGTVTFTLKKPEPKVEILSHQWFEEEYSAGVKGTAKNVSDETLDYVEVSVVFLDDDGAQLDSNFTNTTDLAAGRKWKFEVQYFGDANEVSNYEISADWNTY